MSKKLIDTLRYQMDKGNDHLIISRGKDRSMLTNPWKNSNMGKIQELSLLYNGRVHVEIEGDQGFTFDPTIYISEKLSMFERLLEEWGKFELIPKRLIEDKPNEGFILSNFDDSSRVVLADRYWNKKKSSN